MTAAQIIADAHAAGVRLSVDGERVTMTGCRSAIDGIRAHVIAHKPEVVALLSERAGGTATDAVLAAQQLLRRGEFATTTPERCRYHVGHPGAPCLRCATPWLVHFGRPRGGAA